MSDLLRDNLSEPIRTGIDGTNDLRAYGISREQAAELRARLATFAEDWSQPEMDVYDNYAPARAAHEA